MKLCDGLRMEKAFLLQMSLANSHEQYENYIEFK